jgi:uncharacterized protein (TIGR00255 family)
MATYSMTGYGRAEKIIGSRKYVIELRSLNSKQIDLLIKVPGLLREIEMDLRSLLANELGRGKVECMINYENLGEEKSARINTELIEAYAKEIEPLRSKIKGINESDWLNAMLKLPEVLVTQRAKLEDEEKEALIELCKEAIVSINSFRLKEGEALYNDLRFNYEEIQKNCDVVESLAPLRVDLIRDRIKKSLDELKDNAAFDPDRFEQELIYYIEKLDINEELIRLNTHLLYFKETLELKGEKGKKLGFISQEMGREINTMGSKANHAEMQRHVIQMKDHLERIKEQVLNLL